MSDLITNFTQNQAGQITTLNNQPITESVEVIASASNPGSRGINDVSDTSMTTQPVSLPIRAEKRFIPIGVDMNLLSFAFPTVKDTDFYNTAYTEAKRLQKGVDYFKIRIPHRGVNPSTLLPDPNQTVEFRFLVNPANVTVNRQTVDSQSLTRGGWQFGVWGEDTFLVQMQGTSAGAFFANGLTDEFSYYAVSYRNLMQLQQVFENNGYWFEGEEYAEGPLAALTAPGYTRRRIRMHQDVELWCGNFIWFGMFDNFTISQDATQPFMLNFSLSFFVWKERYRSSSPYWGSIENNVQRGHSYDAVEGTTATIQSNNTLAQYAPSGVNSQGILMHDALSGNPVNAPYANHPAVQSSAAEDLGSTISPTISDFLGVNPLSQLTSPGDPTNSSFWRG